MPPKQNAAPEANQPGIEQFMASSLKIESIYSIEQFMARRRKTPGGPAATELACDSEAWTLYSTAESSEDSVSETPKP